MVEAERLDSTQEDTTWQHRREKLPKPAATRDAAAFGSSQLPGWSSARTASWLLVAEKRGIVRVRHAISTPAAGNI